MKKSILAITFSAMLMLCGLTTVTAQEQPKPQKDTVNMDTDAKPTQYYEIEDDKPGAGSEKSPAILIAGIAIAVVVVGAVAYVLLKKKK
jgi:LPXTG-motif cell wall-anchored protein